MSDLLPMDLPIVGRFAPTAEPVPVVCTVCGDPDWIAVAPGTLSTSELYPASNIVALRSDDGQPLEAWCVGCWTKRFGAPPS